MRWSATPRTDMAATAAPYSDAAPLGPGHTVQSLTSTAPPPLPRSKMYTAPSDSEFPDPTLPPLPSAPTASSGMPARGGEGAVSVEEGRAEEGRGGHERQRRAEAGRGGQNAAMGGRACHLRPCRRASRASTQTCRRCWAAGRRWLLRRQRTVRRLAAAVGGRLGGCDVAAQWWRVGALRSESGSHRGRGCR